MKIINLQELKRYSFDDLLSLFGVSKDKLSEIIKNLLALGVVKLVAQNQLQQSSHKNIYAFTYVGVVMVDNICFAVYPKYLQNYQNDNNRSILKTLIKVIKKYEHKKHIQNLGNFDECFNFNLLSFAISFIKDYATYGLYEHKKQFFELNGDNEIHWDKTMSDTSVYFSNNTPIYLDTFSINKKINERNYFTRLHAAMLSEICNRLGDILTLVGLKHIRLSDEKLSCFGDKSYIIKQIEQELSRQFVTYRQNTLKMMKKYLSNSDYGMGGEFISFVGTSSFHMVWEDICKVYFGGNKKPIEQKPKWYINGIVCEKDTLEPDIIIENKDENTIEIYDAKYYDIKFDGKTVYQNPGVGDVVKQFCYQLSYEKTYKVIKNIFVFPSDTKNNQNEGFVEFEIFEGKKIHLLYLYDQEVFDKYIKS